VLVAAAIALITIGRAGAIDGSTPDAWEAHRNEVVAACAAASNLRDARPGGSLVEFDDRVGFSAVVIEGRYPQAHMKGRRGRVLCLFDKRTRTPFVSDADSLLRKRDP
jgi:hypothetical protein